MPKRATNLSLDSDLLAEAKALKINVSQAAERGIAQTLKAERERRWKEENKEALEAANDYLKKYGLPLARYRQF